MARRRRRRKQTKFITWFKKLSTANKILLIAGAVLGITMLALVIYVSSMFSKINTEELDEDEIIINEEIQGTVGEGYTNIALFGGDSRSGNVTKNLNTDTIIIASLNNETKEVKLVSVYRDTLLDLSNGSIKKCNSAYSRGGAKQAINMLNMNLDLNIQKYVTVDFTAVVDVIDMLGGVEVNVSEKERRAVNSYIWETAKVAGQKINYIEKSGLQTLDGVQATTYARIRKGVGDDYARTERQRLIIEKMVEKALKSDLTTINNIVNKIFPRIATNFSLTEILSYAKDFTKYSIGETTGFPFVKGSGTIPGRGSSVFPITLKSNVAQLHEFLYGTEDYQPSSKVAQISNEIAYVVGNRKADKDTTSSGGNEETEGEGTGGETTGGEGTEGEGTETPGTGTETPGTGTETPGTGTETPGTGTETPGTGTETPGTGTETPGTGTETPGTGTETPGTGTETPGTGTETPGTGTETPGTGTETPGTGSGTETGTGTETGVGSNN